MSLHRFAQINLAKVGFDYVGHMQGYKLLAITVLVLILGTLVGCGKARPEQDGRRYRRVDTVIEPVWVLGLNNGETAQGRLKRQAAGKLRSMGIDAEISRRERETYARSWPEPLHADCTDPRRAPSLCVRLLDAGPFAKESKRNVQIEWRNLPTGSWVEVSLENAAPLGTRWRYAAGESGAMRGGNLGALPQGARLQLFGSGTKTFEWAGDYCRPPDIDVVFGCTKVAVGMYRLKINAIVMEKVPASTIPQQPWLPASGPRSGWAFVEKQTAWSQSPDFQVNGEIDLRSWAPGPNPVWPPLRDGLGKFLDKKLLDQPLPAKKQDQGWCHSLAVTPPLEGVLTICLPSGAVDQYGVHATREDVRYLGNYAIMKGFVTPDKAEVIGHGLVRKLYEPMADTTSLESLFDFEKAVERLAEENGRTCYGSGCSNNLKSMKWLESSVRDGAFVQRNGGYWLFELSEILHYFRDGADGAPQLPNHTVVVKVEGNGTACVVARGGAGYFRPMLTENRYLAREGGVVTEADFRTADWDVPCKQRTAPLEVFKGQGPALPVADRPHG